LRLLGERRDGPERPSSFRLCGGEENQHLRRRERGDWTEEKKKKEGIYSGPREREKWKQDATTAAGEVSNSIMGGENLLDEEGGAVGGEKKRIPKKREGGKGNVVHAKFLGGKLHSFQGT